MLVKLAVSEKSRAKKNIEKNPNKIVTKRISLESKILKITMINKGVNLLKVYSIFVFIKKRISLSRKLK